MANYIGTSASEFLAQYNWNYTWTDFFMNDGDDWVSTPSTGVAYYFDGGAGDDYFLGDSAGDTAWGGTGDDSLNGHSGADYLNGESGEDWLNGGSGNDTLAGSYDADRLNGGTGKDYLTGGTDGSVDHFVFAQGDSASTAAGADVITDWNVRYDFIDMSVAGSAAYYREAATSATSVASARSIVEQSGTLREADHVFLYNANTDTGYLISDLNANYTFETGVIIRGAGAASDMNWSDIL